MKAETQYFVSILLNVVLVVAVCVLVCIVAGNLWPVADSDTNADIYREYQNAVYWGLDMDYEEFLQKRDPPAYFDPDGGPTYFVHLQQLPDSWYQSGQNYDLIDISEWELMENPVVRNLFLPTGPFTILRVNQTGLDSLRKYVQPNAIIQWDRVLYGPLVVSDAVVGFCGILMTGLCVFAYTKRQVSKDPHSRAMRVKQYIFDHPGCNTKEIADDTGFSRGSTGYQIRRLQAEKMIRRIQYHGFVRFYPAGYQRDVERDILWEVVGKDKPHKIFCEILHRPGITQRELGRATEIVVSTLQWHLSRLVMDGVLSVQKGKGFSEYCVTETFVKLYEEIERETRES